MNLAAIEKTLQALPVLGPEHAALEAALKTLAAELDAKPDSPGLWSEYRRMLELLQEVVAGGADDDFFSGFPGVGDPAHSLS
jgi:hypothetical protein